jgi:mycothiol synthase
LSAAQLFMRLPELANRPARVPVPASYTLRMAGPEDLEGVAAVLSDSFEDTWDAERASMTLSAEEGVEATYIVCSGPEVVAVASARLLPALYPGAGYVHYVGVHSSHRGHRLGEVVVGRVLEHFATAGVASAVLETDDFRLPAVRIYLRLGFVPEYRSAGDEARWSQVLRRAVSPSPEGRARREEDDGRLAR